MSSTTNCFIYVYFLILDVGHSLDFNKESGKVFVGMAQGNIHVCLSCYPFNNRYCIIYAKKLFFKYII